MRLIDADKYVCAFVFDEEHEEQRTETMTVEDFLDRFTEEGCPVQEVTEMKWIPVKERLPEEKSDVLVTISDGFSPFVDTDLWDGSRFFCYGNRRVEAWQPLPEPYKEGEQ